MLQILIYSSLLFLRETAYQARLYCDNYLKDTGVRLQMRPYLCGNVCSCCDMFGCSTVDAIDYYTDEESRLQAQVCSNCTLASTLPFFGKNFNVEISAQQFLRLVSPTIIVPNSQSLPSPPPYIRLALHSEVT